MNEYLDNLRNTQGKKSPSKLADTYRNLKMTLSGQSPEKKCKVSTFDIGETNNKLDSSAEENFNNKHDILLDKYESSSEDGDSESSLSDSDNSVDDKNEVEEPERIEIKQEKLSPTDEEMAGRIKEFRRSSSVSHSPLTRSVNLRGSSVTREITNTLTEQSCSHLENIREHYRDSNGNESLYQRNVLKRLSNSPLKNETCQISTTTEIRKNDFIQQFAQLKRHNWLLVFICIACIVSAMAISLKDPNTNGTGRSSSGTDPEKERLQREKFKSLIASMKSKYPNQTNLFWANIQSTFRHSILKSKDPSIVLIVSDETTKALGNDLAHGILNSIKASIDDNHQKNLNNLIIDPMEDEDLVDLITMEKDDKIKLHIDNKLNRIFSSGQRIALVKSISVVPATSMLLFYTYGDDLLSAKYPGVIILMTLNLNEIIEKKSEKREMLMKSQSKLTGFIESYLFKIWSKQVGEDQLRPLFTRIANNVVLVNNE